MVFLLLYFAVQNNVRSYKVSGCIIKNMLLSIHPNFQNLLNFSSDFFTLIAYAIRFIQTQLQIKYRYLDVITINYLSPMLHQNSLASLNAQQPGLNDIVSTDQLLGAIEHSKNMINPMEIKNQVNIDSVIIQGFSGVGKSSMILTLSGQSIIAYHHPKTGVPTLATRDPAGKKGVKIEEKIQAGTINPACSELTKSVAKEGDIVVLWDMPGIGQNRGLTQSLINSYYYTRIFQLQHSIKIVFAINHTDLDYSMKGINIERSFTDFLKMFGAITPFQRSVLFVITKAPVHFTSEHAVQCFKDVLKLAFVRNNKSIYDLVEKLSKGKIPIIVFRYPTFDSHTVNSANPQDVTEQYTSFVEEFYSSVKSLKPTRDIKLNAPAMSTAERNKCSAFVTNTQTIINNDAGKLCGFLETYLKEYFLAEIEGNKNMRKAINSISSMRFFVKKFTDLINISGNPKKQQLKATVDKLHNHLISCERRPFCVKESNKEIRCMLMQNLANNFIMVNFLNILSFHKQEKYTAINQIEVMKAFFKRLRNLDVGAKWNVYEQAFKKKIGQVIINLYENHLKGWQSSQIYYHWKNNFRFFPSLVQRLSKFIKSKKETGNFALNYFEQVANIERGVSLKSSQMEQINSLLKYNKSQLNFDLDQGIMTGNIIPMLQRKQKEMVSKVISFDKWEQAIVEQSLSQFNTLNKPVVINGEERQFSSTNYASSNEQSLKSVYMAMKSNVESLLEKNEALQEQMVKKNVQIKQLRSDLDQAKCCRDFWCCCCCCFRHN